MTSRGTAVDHQSVKKLYIIQKPHDDTCPEFTARGGHLIVHC